MAERRVVSASGTGTAFYARRGSRRGDWWTLLHPPYTIWHLSYVVLGAAMAPRLSWAMLGGTIVAFFLAVGLAAHALDELHGRPLNTGISTGGLWTVAICSMSGAVLVGALAVPYSGLVLVPCIGVGVLLVLGYNLELFDGRLHTDLGFAAAWGGFPVAVAFLAQAPPLTRPVTAAGGAAVLAAVGLSYAQRRLSTPARTIRRRLADITAVATLPDGTQQPVDRASLLAPLEATLKALSVAVPLLAIALLLTHLH
ncbi:MAG: hypothetical protein DLM57_03485 [Pseudonocardiales bacterium]|nr:MAG: hypothetical protein DLM57_03485 [Pseudonocardiales bacterium]